jgi:hypothetical protein
LVITVVLVVLAGLGAGGWFGFSKYKQHKAAQEAKAGNPAAQVPTPSDTAATGAMDVLGKVHQAYTNLTSLSVSGTSMMVMDMSHLTAADINPGQAANGAAATRRPANIPKGITNSTEVEIKLARPNLYRIQQIGKTAAGRQSMTNTTAAWSSGTTNFVLTMVDFGRANQSYRNYTTAKDRNTALTRGDGTPMAACQTIGRRPEKGPDDRQTGSRNFRRRQDGRADPTMNARLFTAVEKAKKESVTKDAIERAINKGAGIGDEKLVMEHVVYEGRAPHNVPVIVEVYTDNVNRTAPEIRVLFKKGQLGHGGSNKFLFDHVGLVEAHHPDANIDREGGRD